MATTYAWSQKYPWINFAFDVTKLGYKVWVALGECQSICTHIGNIPLSPEIRATMHQIYLAKGVLATTAIEGNTLSEDDVRMAIRGELTLPPSKEYLKQEVDNIIDVFNEIGVQIHDNRLPEITPPLMCTYNAQVLRHLTLDKDVEPGVFRKHSVVVGSYKGPPTGHVPEMVRLLCDHLRQIDETPDQDQIVKAILKAIYAHLYVVWIHPFGDGNGRTARLLEAVILLQSGVPSPAAHLLSNFYNSTRTEYYRMLDRASKGMDWLGFVSYAIMGLRDELRDQRQHLMKHVWRVVWKNHIYETFGEKQTDKAHRQRQLALDLAKQTKPVRLSEIKTLSPKLTEAYAGKRSMATIRRDVAALVDMKLAESVKIENQIAIQANIDLLTILLPIRNKGNERADHNRP